MTVYSMNLQKKPSCFKDISFQLQKSPVKDKKHTCEYNALIEALIHPDGVTHICMSKLCHN